MIGIITPYYGRNEVTAAALRLADLAHALGVFGRLITLDRRNAPVHPFWDNHVCKADDLCVSLQDCRYVVHLVVDPRLHDQAVTLKTGDTTPKQILVPSWHAMRVNDLGLLTIYDQVVCPSKSCYNVFGSLAFPELPSEEFFGWCRFDPGITQAIKRGPMQPNHMRACFYCDQGTIDFCGPLVLSIINECLRMNSMLSITVMSSRSWCREDRLSLRRLRDFYGERLNVIPVPTLPDLNRALFQHDWVAIPSVRGDYGIVAARALACGTPVIANEVDPFAEVVTNNHHGLLVRCDICTGALGAPIAVPHVGRWLEACMKAFNTPELLRNLLAKNWGLQPRQTVFNRYWQNAWGC